MQWPTSTHTKSLTGTFSSCFWVWSSDRLMGSRRLHWWPGSAARAPRCASHALSCGAWKGPAAVVRGAVDTRAWVSVLLFGCPLRLPVCIRFPFRRRGGVLENFNFFCSGQPQGHQPPTTNRHRQPPTIVQFCFCGLVCCPYLHHEAETVPVSANFCWRCESSPPLPL